MTHDITRHTHFKDFSILPNDLVQDERMTFSAKGLLCYLLSLPEDWNINVSYIAKTFQVSERSILKDLQILINLGYCMRTPKRIGNKMCGQRYQVTDIPNEFAAPLKNEGTEEHVPAPHISRTTTTAAPREDEGTYKEHNIYNKEHSIDNKEQSEGDESPHTPAIKKGRPASLNIKTEPQQSEKANNPPSCANPPSLEKRELAFQEDVYKFVEQYGKPMCDAFISYWTEPNKSRTKMHFEMEKTWDTKRRLATWAGRERGSKPTAAARRREDNSQRVSNNDYVKYLKSLQI